MESLLLCASKRSRATKYRLQLGTPNEVSGWNRLYTLVVYVSPKKTTTASVIKQPWRLSEIEHLIKLNTIKQRMKLSKTNE